MFTRLLLIATVVIWGWTFVATKICLEYLTPVELLGLRLLIGLPALIPLMVRKKIRLNFDRGSTWRALIGAAVITAHFLIQINGLKYTSATNTGWIIAISPLVLAVLSFLFLKEKIGVNGIIGIGIATVGILLLVSKGKLASLQWLTSFGDWMILASAHTWAIYTVVTRDLSRRQHPLAVTLAVLLPAAVLMVVYMLFTSDWSHFLHLPLKPLLALLFLAIVGLALGHWFWQEGVSKIGAAKAGIFLYLEPLATTVLAVPLLHESFGFFTALGGLLVLMGVWYAQRQKRPAEQTVPAASETTT
jgi:drug/metabolite transporter (DMT)-like permease